MSLNRLEPIEYIPVLDARHIQSSDHENTVQNNLKFSSSPSILYVLTLRSLAFLKIERQTEMLEPTKRKCDHQPQWHE
jgi:hypothetical protein